MPNSLKTYQRRPSEKKLKGALSDILKTEDNYIDNDIFLYFLYNINISGIGWLVGGSFMGETFLTLNVTV